jgi:hypothetical protein
MATYQDIRQQVETLSASEQLRLLEELVALVRHHTLSTSEVEVVAKDTTLTTPLANQAEANELTVAERLAQRERVFLEGA